jgi:hypothetical protein
MRRMFDIAFLLTIAVICIGIDFYIQKRNHADQALGQSFGLAHYIALRKDNFQDIVTPPSLAGAMPSEISGWEISQNGGDQMIANTKASRAQQANEIALIKAVAALEKGAAPKGDMIGVAMRKGDTRLRVLAVLQEETGKIEGIETASSGSAKSKDVAIAALQQMIISPAPGAARDTYAIVDGVAFEELPAGEVIQDRNMRMMRAKIGKSLSVTVVTTSTDDEAIREAMRAIDFVMLNKLLHSPLAGIKEGRQTDVRNDPPAADVLASAQAVHAEANVAPLDAALAVGATQADVTSLPAALQQSGTGAASQRSVQFVSPPLESMAARKVPCVRRSGVLVCPIIAD